jgi:hypothetical protein
MNVTVIVTKKITILAVSTGMLLGSCFPNEVFAFGTKSEQVQSEGEANSSSLSSANVWVTRPDGGQQCSPQSGQSLDTSSAELKKAQVRVLNSQKGSDNKLHAQMCGIPSGKTNMFQIPRDDLSKASALGYHEVKDAP